VGNFNAKIRREGFFKPVNGSWSLHETSNENRIRAIDFATNNNNNKMYTLPTRKLYQEI
jgi:hypothetical protein